MTLATFKIALSNKAFFAVVESTVEAGTDAARIAGEKAQSFLRETEREEAEMASALGQDGPGRYLVKSAERLDVDALEIGCELVSSGSNG